MKKLSLLLIIVLLLCAGSAFGKGSIEGQKYRNTDYGFRVTAPDGWSLSKNVGASLILLESPDGQVGFRVYVKLMAGLVSPVDFRKQAKREYGIRGDAVTIQRLIESWEGAAPVYLPLDTPSYLDPVVEPLNGEAVSGEGAFPEAEGIDSIDGESTVEPAIEEVTIEPPPVVETPPTADYGVDDDPDAGMVAVEDWTVMEALIMLQQSTGVPYKDKEIRDREHQAAKEGEDQPVEAIDPLTAVLAELADAKPYIAIYDTTLTDPTTGETTKTRRLACYVLRNMVGYTFVATMPQDRFELSLRELISIYDSLQIPGLDGGRYGSAGSMTMDPQTTGVVVGKVLVRGTAIPGASISLYRTEADYQNRRPYKTTTSSFSGEFQLVGVSPGTYYRLEATADLGEQRLITYLPITELKVRRGFASFYNLELEQVQ
ncbi:carboxypeptidase-like regulatory domain-containing protein [bacterium]|nr:carboxypeptidase-like regulatory domain-containing protein [bacterium]